MPLFRPLRSSIEEYNLRAHSSRNVRSPRHSTGLRTGSCDCEHNANTTERVCSRSSGVPCWLPHSFCARRECGVPRQRLITYNDSRFFEAVPQALTRLLFSVSWWMPQFEVKVFQREDVYPSMVEFAGPARANDVVRLMGTEMGAGYWLWKPYMIVKELATLDDGDVLIYVDNRLAFVEDPVCLIEPLLHLDDLVIFRNKPNEAAYPVANELTGRSRFPVCGQHGNSRPSRCTRQPLSVPNTSFIKRDVIEKHGLNGDARKIYAPWAGAMVLRKSARSVAIANEWLQMCFDYHDLSNEASILPEHHQVLHRNDQSMLTIVMQRHHLASHYLPCHAIQNTRAPFCGKCRPKILCNGVHLQVVASHRGAHLHIGDSRGSVQSRESHQSRGLHPPKWAHADTRSCNATLGAGARCEYVEPMEPPAAPQASRARMGNERKAHMAEASGRASDDGGVSALTERISVMTGGIDTRCEMPAVGSEAYDAALKRGAKVGKVG